MNPKIIDRRISRTRDTLQKALISMILRKDKDYDAITIKDIIDVANVGRSTFYAHYTGKDDLLRSGFENLREMILEQQENYRMQKGDDKNRHLSFSLIMIEHALGHADLYRALLGGHGGTVAHNGFRDLLADLVRAEFAITLVEDKVAPILPEFAVQYTVGAFTAILTWWLEKKRKISAEQLDVMFRRMTCEGVLLSNE